MQISSKIGSVVARPSLDTIEGQSKRDWTVLYVLNGDSDLREAVTLDLVELDQAGVPDNVNVAAQLYRGDLKWNLKNFGRKLKNLAVAPKKTAVQSDWRGMRVFEVRHQDSAEKTTERNSPGLSRDSSVSDPESLKKFVAWGMKMYPAENYAVVIGGHSSPEGTLADGSGKGMSFPQVAEALKGAAAQSGEKLDLVLLDSCSAGTEATAKAFRGTTDFLVASATKIEGGGWSEKATLQFLKDNPGASPSDLAHSLLSPEHERISEPKLYQP